MSEQETDALEIESTANGPTEGADRCKNCGTTAPADAMGLCSNPKCRAVRKGAKLAAKHGPINKKRRKELRERFLLDYRPTTTIDEIRCRELADIAERLEVVKKGTMDHQRLIQTAASLTSSLEESVRNRVAQPPAFENATTEDLVAKLESLLAFAKDTQQLTIEVERRQAEDRDRLNQLANATPAIQDADVQVPLATEQREAGISQPDEIPKQNDEADEERAAEIRRKRGWTSVHVEGTNRRYRE